MVGKKLQLPPAFDEIVRRHEREILRYLLRISRDRDDALDLFQETWLRAYRAYPRLDPASQVRPWLYAIAINLCRNRARDGARRGRVIAAGGLDQSAANKVVNGNGALIENDGYAAVRLRQSIARLPEKQREALRLRYFAGLNYQEIALAMECSEENARANVSQALKKFRMMWTQK
jgi:RNA polymerase sigma factor (sigma-70 family)